MRVQRTILAAGAMLIVTLVGGGTWALAHGGNTELVHSCVNNQSGDIRVVEPKDECMKGETPLEWNFQGPTGLQGPIGRPGVLGFYTRFNLGGACPDGFNCAAIAVCDPGDAVTGGGFEHGAVSSDGNVTVMQSLPTSDTIWQVILGNYSGSNVDFRAYARCADLTP